MLDLTRYCEPDKNPSRDGHADDFVFQYCHT